MNIKNLIALVAVVFASFIQVGCGSAVPTTLGYNQAGSCQMGYTMVNGQCVYGAANTGVCPTGSTLINGQCISTGNTTGTTGGQGCQSGYFYVQAPGALGCYQQGICYQGYAYVTPLNMCVWHN